MSHHWKMLIGCLLPLLLIFVLPLFGVSGSVTLFLFIVLMFGCHLLMMGGRHGEHGHGSKGGRDHGHDEGDRHASA